uniref:G-protein coupled receptors family 1 profile domain-containing protein n=1 Tax=Ciona intestinalis TaxID=7719 RepID=F6WTU1_CIOIN
MILSFDRHQVIARPFRYHTGELLPPKVAAILIGSGWTFCFVIGLSVTSQSVEQAERDNDLKIDGSLFPVYRISGVQKWLLGCGMLMVFVITVQMLVSAMVIVNKRAKERKLQLLTGVGIPEPLQSRNNSVCHVTNKSKINQSTVIDDSNENSEADANDFLLSGGFGKDNTVRYDVIPFSYCVTCAIFELLLAGQGIAYVIIYIITDDEFRPAILKPFSAIGCTKTYRKPRRKYSIDRRRSRVESGVDYNGAGLQMRTTNSGD